MKLRFGRTRTNTLVKFHSLRTNCNIVLFHLAMIALRIISTADSWFAFRLIACSLLSLDRILLLLLFHFYFQRITQRLLRFFSFIGDRWQFRRKIVFAYTPLLFRLFSFCLREESEDEGLKADDSRSSRSLRL